MWPNVRSCSVPSWRPTFAALRKDNHPHHREDTPGCHDKLPEVEHPQGDATPSLSLDSGLKNGWHFIWCGMKKMMRSQWRISTYLRCGPEGFTILGKTNHVILTRDRGLKPFRRQPRNDLQVLTCGTIFYIVYNKGIWLTIGNQTRIFDQNLSSNFAPTTPRIKTLGFHSGVSTEFVNELEFCLFVLEESTNDSLRFALRVWIAIDMRHG